MFSCKTQRIISRAIIFSYHENSFWYNDVPLLKVVAFNVALSDVTLFDVVLFIVAQFWTEL